MRYFSGYIFFLRFTYDFFFIFILSFCLYDYCYQKNCGDLPLTKMIMLISPVIVGQPLIYILSVLPNKEHNEKRRFRMVKTKVQTDEENTTMYSSDDEKESEVFFG
jgi:hypothetical protein